MIFARELIAQLDQIKELPPAPDDEVGKGEEVVGTLSDDLRKLFALREQFGGKLVKLTKKWAHDEVDRMGRAPSATERAAYEELQRQIRLTKIQVKVVTALFWASVQTEFPQLVGRTMAIRKDWQVIGYDEQIGLLGISLLELLSPLPFDVD